jgi:hypothetical protein
MVGSFGVDCGGGAFTAIALYCLLAPAPQKDVSVGYRIFVGLLFGVPGLCALGVGPLMLGERVVVDDDHFEQYKPSLFGDAVNHNIRFEELESITFKSTTSFSRRGLKTKYHFDCAMKKGGGVWITVDDLMEEASGQIIENARRKGVKLIGFD